ncbi:MFS transporter [Chloroflexota bacterium]
MFKIRLPRIFFGWWIVIASFITTLYVGGIIVYGFTAIFEPLLEEFQWSYTQISLAASIRGLETGILAPVFGLMVDRWGPRKLIFSGIIVTALGLLLISQVNSLPMFYLAFIITSVGMSACSMTVPMTAIAHWFKRKLGLAMGIAVSGFGFSGLLIPLIVKLIDSYGWRTALDILALGMIVLILPLSLVFRHKPEQYGYSPDDEAEATSSPTSDGNHKPDAKAAFGLKQALRNKAFWYISLAFTYHALAINAVVIHVMPYLSSLGFARSFSSMIAAAIPLTSIIGRLGIGWFSDKTNRKHIAAAAFIMIALGILCFGFTTISKQWLIILFLILVGIGYGGTNSLRPALVSEYFGRANFGAIIGFVIGINMLGNFAGPPVAGWVFDSWGSYRGIWVVFAGLGLLATLLIINIPRPEKRHQQNI